ncbi:hypothetical protein RI129_011427 [Pyrocoelia pectoralis]|uniref:Cytochrome P450 n=1 Tax=Pyrocoelia pectoralis TaxID=417401 RepID=A0AAN7V805_9COLE
MWLIVTLFVAMLCLWSYLDARKPKKFPPGPRWYPIIGCAMEMEKIHQETGSFTKTTSELSRRYGPLVGTKIGVTRIVFVYGVKEINELFTREEFVGRPDGIFYRTRTGGKRTGILFNDSKSWQEQKKFVLKQLKAFGPGTVGMRDILEEEVAVVVDNIKKRIELGGGRCILRMDNFFGVHILNILWGVITGKKYNAEGKEIKELERVFVDMFAQFNMTGPLFSNFPILRYLCPNFSGYNDFFMVHKRLHMFIMKEIQRAKEVQNLATSRGIIDGYLMVLQSPGKSDTYSEDELAAVCLDLFSAGAETSSKALSHAFLYLLLHPHVQERAQEEIDVVVGRERNPDLNDKPRLKYVESVMLESLRIYIGRSHIVPHRALKDTTFNGYFIPKDTTLIANTESILSNEKAGWINPEIFNPDRFLKDDALEIPDYFVPFGLSKRRCTGESVARQVLFLIIAGLLQKFKFEAVPDDPPSTEYVDGFTEGVKPFKAIISLR